MLPPKKNKIKGVRFSGSTVIIILINIYHSCITHCSLVVHMWITIGSGNGLFPAETRPLPVFFFFFTSHWWGPVVFTREQFHSKSPRYYPGDDNIQRSPSIVSFTHTLTNSVICTGASQPDEAYGIKHQFKMKKTAHIFLLYVAYAR